ncbi:MAG: geranylgeranyl reductase family protein [Methanobacteriaceae archaeon]
MDIYDVIIVGAGPVGSHLAYNLAKKGIKVCVLEKKTQVGIPLQCAGILSKKVLDLIDIHEEFILNRVKGAYLHSPNNSILKIAKNDPEAYIIDRVAFDQYLAKKAEDAGATILMAHNVCNVDTINNIVSCKNGEVFHSKIIVGADGYKSPVSKALGNVSKYFKASQFLIEVNGNFDSNDESNKLSGKLSRIFGNNEFVSLFTSQNISPGFLWVIPTSNNQFRVGMFSNHDFKFQKDYINEFLEGLSNGYCVDNNQETVKIEVLKHYKGYIPIFDGNKNILENTTMLIGDAASQIKPTTGGGIVMAFDAVKIATPIIERVLNQNNNSNCNNNANINCNNSNNNNNNNNDNSNNDNSGDANDSNSEFNIFDINIAIGLKDYTNEFNKRYSSEISYQFKFHNVFSALKDSDLDYIFDKMRKYGVEELISQHGHMDDQSNIIKRFLTNRSFIYILPKIIKAIIINKDKNKVK